MTTISYTAVRGNLANAMKRACEDHDPVLITRQNAESVVMLSLEDYEALCETNYLLQSPKNAKRLFNSITELNAGKGKARELIK
ncbi:MAG: type II toxin-antitoxin system prevent-host-death family antitoxin [Chitinispirillaceae bacterium]|nr:type II toxin-antitoxin system prevent-host-death family antitoxin [Chitinispirillaceae bacterium]